MASQKQMVIKSLFIAISVFVVTSQDIFGQPVFSRACYGTFGDQCANTKLSCGTDENVLISDIVYKGKDIACSGICTQEACCEGETNISEENILHLNKMEINEACSGKQSCTLLSPNYALNTSGRVTSIEVKYYCIEKSKIINYCEMIKQSNTTVHIMYNGQTDHYVSKDCYCSIQSDYDIDLYSVDIRLQNIDSTSPQCTNTTLKWGYNQTEYVEQCKRPGHHSSLRTLTVTKDMWVRLFIQDTHPTMVWIAAKATRGKVNVTCGQRNSNTLGTTTTLSASSHITTINTKTQSISSAITSKSDSGSTTVTGSAISPNVSTTVQLLDQSVNTTVAAIGLHSHSTVSDDDTNIGAIVGPVIGIIIIAVLVVIGLIFLRRRRAKQRSSQSATTRACEIKASDYDIISDYDKSKPIVLPTGSKVANGEPVALSSFGDSYKRENGNAISDVVNDMYSDINLKDMVSDDPSRNDNSESEYNHLHDSKACGTDAHSGNVYSHVKTSLRNTIPRNDDYDHFGCNKPNTLKDNNVSSLSSTDYDHLSNTKTNNAMYCNQPITTHIQQTTTQDDTVKTSGNSNTPGGLYTATEPSCEYAKVKRGKPVAASGYEMAGILNDVEL